ncbi:MAG TPA: FecR family protein [Candidatus Acidoferrales bacterium]
MKTRHPAVSSIALIVSALLVMPAGLGAQQAAQPSAGKITTVLPVVNVVRGQQQSAASVNEQVFWGDTINTGHLARARVSLDDGSILSVGSDSNLMIGKHDPAAQQTDLDLNYGRVRAKAAALVKPDSHFRVRTPVGVAGVVGTEMVVIFDTTGAQMKVICLEGTCQVCDLAGNCLILHAGQESSVQNNSSPTPPSPATTVDVVDAVNTTAPGGAAGSAGGIGAAGGIAIGVGAAAAAAIATVIVRSVSKTPTCGNPTPTAAAAGVTANCATANKAATGKSPGQRP